MYISKPCLRRPTLIDFNSNELHYNPFIISLDECNESCNTLQDASGRIFVLNKTEHVNFIMFNMIWLTSCISCDCKCKFDGRKCDSNQKWNDDKRQFEC